MDKQTLTVINGNNEFAGLAPHSWFRWLPEHFAHNVLDELFIDLENLTKLTDCPLEGAQALYRAFLLKLDRFTGWDGSFLTEPKQIEGLQWASKIFKRGVAIKLGKKSQDVGPPSPKSKPYPINLIQQANFLNQNQNYKRASQFVCVDSFLLTQYGEIFGGIHRICPVVAHETQKNIKQLITVLSAWKQQDHPKEWHIFGGGLTLDLVAFAASLVGADIYLWPTTLLAIADASVGGKTAVNISGYGKNQLGKFFLPLAVNIYLPFLSTLSKRQWLSGGAECLKHFIISADLILLEKCAHILIDQNRAALKDILPDILAVKAQVVERDPREVHERKILNLGHTLGHAIETYSMEKLSTPLCHGEAIAIGLAFALMISRRLFALDPIMVNRYLDLIKKSGILPSLDFLVTTAHFNRVDLPNLVDDLCPFLLHDKKNTSNNQSDFSNIQWVLIDKISPFSFKLQGIKLQLARDTWQNELLPFLASMV